MTPKCMILYPLAGGGQFLKYLFELSPECHTDWPTHTYGTHLSYLINEIYPADRTWHNYLQWEHRFRGTGQWSIKADHEEPEVLQTHDDVPKIRVYHESDEAVQAWITTVSTNFSLMAHDWHTDPDHWTVTDMDPATDRKQPQLLNAHMKHLPDAHAVDWIWADWDTDAYVKMCDQIGITPVVDEGRQFHTHYAKTRNRVVRSFHAWIDNNFPNKIKQLRELHYKYHTQ